MHAAKTTARTMTNTNSVVLSVSMLMFFLYFLYPPSCLAVEAPRPQSPGVDFADEPGDSANRHTRVPSASHRARSGHLPQRRPFL